MATPPGSAGLPIFGDKSVDFYKDPIGMWKYVIILLNLETNLFILYLQKKKLNK